MKLIEEYIPYHSLTQFVKSIPDEYQADINKNLRGIPNKTEIFLQKATLATLSRVAKRHLFAHFCKNNPQLKKKMQRAHEEMLDSFDQS